jgi:hypothetical protein
MYKMLNNYFIQLSDQSVRSVKDLFCCYIIHLGLFPSGQDLTTCSILSWISEMGDACAGSSETCGLSSWTRSSVTVIVKENDMDQNYASIPQSTCDSL